MSVRSRIAAIAAATLIAVPVGLSAFAQSDSDSATITQSVNPNTPGGLIAVLDNAELSPVTFSFENEQGEGTLVLEVRDERGTLEGWTVTLVAEDFVGHDAGHTIPSSGFVVDTFNQPTAQYGIADGLETGEDTISLGKASTALYAIPTTGSGIFFQDIDVSLTVPAETPPDTYESTVTVTITNGPPGN